MKTFLKGISTFIVLFLLSNNLLAAKFGYIDSLSIQMPIERSQSIDALVTYCENHAMTDLDRVRFYFVWVATHIKYDETAISDKQNLDCVFSTKKAVCSGFSRLLGHLCEQSGIVTRYVAGYGKELSVGVNIQNHAWNVIRIEGIWYPFDVTWAADELGDDTLNALPPAFEDWFMSVPEIFQKTHLPFDPVYQLSNHLIKRRDFFSDTAKQVLYTEGAVLPVFDIGFSAILNEEVALDSLEKTWRSFRRGYDFMPMDSAIAIKLAKAQDAKVKRTFAAIQEFSQTDYPLIRQSAIATLKTDLSKLQELEKPIEAALDAHAELESFPLSEDNKQMVKQNHLFYKSLVDFTQKAIKELNEEITTR